MKLLLILSLLFSIFFAKGQEVIKSTGDVFNPKLYPKDSFTIADKKFELGKSQIIIHLVQHEYDTDGSTICERWVEQRIRNKIINSKYFSYNEGENNFSFAETQPIAKYFIFSDKREFTGDFYLVKEDGTWITLPGMWIFASQDKLTLYTTTPDECGKCNVAKFDVKLEKTEIRQSEKTEFYWKEVNRKTLIDFFRKDDDLIIH